MLAKCRRCGVNGDHAVGAIRGVFYPCPHAHHCPLPATGSGRKRGTQPPTPVFVHLFGGDRSQAPCYRDRSVFFFGGGGVGCLSPSLSLSLMCPSPSLSVCLSFCALSASVFVSTTFFWADGFFSPTIVPAAPPGTMRLV